MTVQMNNSNGAAHLRWIERFHLALLPLGTFAWVIKSVISSVIFLFAGLVSFLLWVTQKWTVERMLTPSKKRRWFYGLLGLSKLVLIAFSLNAIVKYFPTEVLPFVTGILLFVAAILLEAARLLIRSFRSACDDGNQL
ncbi:MAG: hypothetical protein LBB40_04525 [Holophagales bacterium]|jgi:uncharacterized membrane protein|nr:hypothetical protein [Holophagales bacterium]